MTTYHHGNLRAALLRAAGEQLEKDGIAALSLREAARSAGVSHNAPYRHFPDRDSLLAALAKEGFELLQRELRERPAGERAQAYVEFGLARPQRFRLMFGGPLSFDRHPELRALASGCYADATAFAALGDEAPLAAAAAWALVHGLAQLILEGHLAGVPRGGGAAFARQVLTSVRLARAAQRTA